MTRLSLVPEAELLFGRIEELAAKEPAGEADAVVDSLLGHLAEVAGQGLIEDDEGFYTRDAILGVGAEATLALAGGDVKVAIDVAAAVAAERTIAGEGPVPARREPGGRWSQTFIAEVVSLIGYECSLPPGERDMEFALEATIGAALATALGMRLEAERRLYGPAQAELRIAPRLFEPASRALGWIARRTGGDKEARRR